eukprot:7925711-Alexandrium_andersonii.AAC.1
MTARSGAAAIARQDDLTATPAASATTAGPCGHSITSMATTASTPRAPTGQTATTAASASAPAYTVLAAGHAAATAWAVRHSTAALAP